MSISSSLFAASINPNAPCIDLHYAGSIQDALQELESALFEFAQEREPYCRVIYGIGTGALRKAVYDVLEKHPLVRAFEGEESGGSCVVIL